MIGRVALLTPQILANISDVVNEVCYRILLYMYYININYNCGYLNFYVLTQPNCMNSTDSVTSLPTCKYLSVVNGQSDAQPPA